MIVHMLSPLWENEMAAVARFFTLVAKPNFKTLKPWLCRLSITITDKVIYSTIPNSIQTSWHNIVT